MKRFAWGLAVLGVLVIAWLVSRPVPVAAAEGFNVITSPLPIKILTQPGKTVTTELRIKNQGSQAEGIKVGLMKFAASGDSGAPNLYDLTPRDTYASWVHFSPQQFTAQPNVWMTVTMTINVPADADLGYYLAVTFSPAQQPDVPDATSLKGSAATLVLLNVNTPNEKRALNLVSFDVGHQLYEYLPANFTIKIHNSGNIYIAPVGNIFVSTSSKPVDTLDFNLAGGSVLPQANRVFKESWKNGFPSYEDKLVNGKPVPDKHDQNKQTLKWDFTHLSKFRFGHYSARLVAVYDDGQQDVPLEAVVSFWVIPWKMMLIVLAVVALIGFGIFALLRSVYRKGRSLAKKTKKHEKTQE